MRRDPPLSRLNAAFRDRLMARAPLLGTFIKTPHPIVVEILALAGFDFVVIDAEHGPFDRSVVDLMLLAGQAANLPIIVRVPDDRPSTLLSPLDSGAAGVMVPHVTSAEQAARVAQACRYSRHGRGYAGTTRAAGYGTRDPEAHFTSTEREVTVICQIEDARGAENAGEIAAVTGVDAVFVGRADLAVSCGFTDFFAPETSALAKKIVSVASAPMGLYCAPTEDLQQWRVAGATLIVTGSDHTLLLQGGAELRRRFAQD